ncbi:MAG: hypothetical protein U0894_04165 [Pirellulales bacterium]
MACSIAAWKSKFASGNDDQDAFEAELAKRQKSSPLTSPSIAKNLLAGCEPREYTTAQFKLGDFPEEGFDRDFYDLTICFRHSFVAFQFFLRKDAASPGKVFVAWHLFSPLTPEEYATKGHPDFGGVPKRSGSGKK